MVTTGVKKTSYTKKESGRTNLGFEDDDKNGSSGFSLPRAAVNEIPKKSSTDGSSIVPPTISKKVSDGDLEAAGDDDDFVPERDQWSNQLEFLLSCLSMSVGLGNVWRFPVIAYKHGGGAFLIPYLIVLFFVGRPIYFLELCVGQFCSQTQVKIWRANPLFKGVGWAAMIATVCVVTYYSSIMATTIWYFFASFSSTLPWTVCDEDWGVDCALVNAGLANTSTAELYFIKEVLNEKANINDGIGYPEWRLSLCLLATWLIIYFTIIKGVKSSGKVAYFTALFPYVILITFLIRGVTLEGADVGILEFITPVWSKLYDPVVWYEAVSQAFFSLNTGFGSVIMFASYNPFRHNIYRDALILSVMDTLTSFVAGITVFSVLGFIATTTNQELKNVAGDGETVIAFIAYPTAIAQFPAPQVFGVLFFLMLFTLGIGSATADAGAVIALIYDKYPKFKRWQVATLVCVLAYLVSLIYCTPGGQFILTLVDYYGVAMVIFFTSIVEVIGLIWVYGLNNFLSDMEFMLNMKLGWYWRICWAGIIPVGLSTILVYALVTVDPLSHNDVEFPTSAVVCGWLLAVTCITPLPIFAFLALYKAEASDFIGKVKEAASPAKNWGPMHPKNKAEWIEHKRTHGRD